MNKAFILLICFPLTFIFAQNSNIDVDGNSTLELFEDSGICADEITVQSGSSLTAYDYGQIKDGDCTTVITPDGGGNITLPIELTDIENLPNRFTIEAAYPNPFNPSTTIHYGIPNNEEVAISIYDIRGRLVINLFKAEQSVGWYEITWNGLVNDGSLAPAGLYFYKIIAGNEIKTSKISLVK
ncbi:T9SS type A sorting domain-containing protein [Candidatus Neomarinimicrobiota bacterium]